MDINEEFDKLQTEYLSTRSDKAIYELYKLIRGYMTGFLKSYARKKKFFMDDLEGKTEDCTYFIIEQYIKKPGWKIDRFTAYYHNAIVKIVHGEKQKQHDEIQKNIKKIRVDDNKLDMMTTDIERELKTLKELQQPVCNDPAVECLRHRWKQGELFESEDL